MIEISKCCKAYLIEDSVINPRDHHDSHPIYVCSKCNKECEAICATCWGTGEINTMEKVYPGEPHEAPIGTQKCPDCKI